MRYYSVAVVIMMRYDIAAAATHALRYARDAAAAVIMFTRYDMILPLLYATPYAFYIYCHY